MDLNGLLPVFVRLRGRRVLLVGGGAMATLRARQFLKAGARLTVVSPHASHRIRQLAKTRAITWIKRDFASRDVSRKYFMVVGATDNPRVQAALSKAAESKGLLYNVVDAPAQCNFITPAVVERGDLKIAMSSASEMVDKLVNLGFVYRAVDEENRRQVVIFTTDKGEELIRELRRGIVENYRGLLNKLSDHDQERLVNAFEELAEILGKLE